MAYAYLAKLLKISQGAGGEASDLERLEHARVPEAKVGGRACAAASCSRDPSEAEPQLAAGSFADEPRWSGRLLPRNHAYLWHTHSHTRVPAYVHTQWSLHRYLSANGKRGAA